MDTTNPQTKGRRRGGFLTASEQAAINADEQPNDEPAPIRRHSVKVGWETTKPSTPSVALRRPTVYQDISANSSRLQPNFRRLSGNERRSSYAGTPTAKRNSIRPTSNLLEVDPKSRQYAVVRGKSETKLKADQEKHMPANEALTDQQVMAFKEAFDLFDNNGGGTIDALELKETLESVGIELDESEIHDVMMRLDKDGNGEIDFDEFLDLMTNTEMFLEAFASRHDPTNKTHERDVLLFDALTEFMKKSALKEAHEIVGYYAKKYKKVVKSYNANKGAHVVGHYADGARLIGLTEKQIAQQLKKLRLLQNFENKGDKESPYAQPLQLSVLKSVTSPSPKKPRGRKRKQQRRPKTPATAPASLQKTRDRSSSQSTRKSIQEQMLLPAATASLNRQTSSSDTNLKIQQAPKKKRKNKIVLKIINNDLLQKEPSKEAQLSKQQQEKKSKTSRLKEEVQEHKPGWLSQRNKMYNVVINMPMRYRSVQVDRLPKLRAKVLEAKGKFRDVIAKKKIENNLRHYKELDSRRIPSATLYEHFQRVFSAYSSAETNNRTAVTAEQLKKASKQNNYHKSTLPPSTFYYTKL